MVCPDYWNLTQTFIPGHVGTITQVHEPPIIRIRLVSELYNLSYLIVAVQTLTLLIIAAGLIALSLEIKAAEAAPVVPHAQMTWENYNFASGSPTVAHHKRDVTKVDVSLSPLLDAPEYGQHSLGAVANLGLGAAIVPEGLAIISSDFTYIPLVVDLVPPHWLPENLRHPNWRNARKGQMPECYRMIDPKTAASDCPASPKIELETDEILSEFVHKYEGIVNPAYYAQMMREFCRGHGIAPLQLLLILPSQVEISALS